MLVLVRRDLEMHDFVFGFVVLEGKTKMGFNEARVRFCLNSRLV